MTSSRTAPAQAFLQAVAKGNIAEVNAYIAANRNNPSALNTASEGSGSTALILAAGFGHEAVVTALLAASGIDASRKNNAGLDALAFAKQRKQTAIVTLLENARSSTATNSNTISANEYLKRCKDWRCCQVRQYILANISNRAAINIRHTESQDTALH